MRKLDPVGRLTLSQIGARGSGINDSSLLHVVPPDLSLD
jgi:hypothetical protein